MCTPAQFRCGLKKSSLSNFGQKCTVLAGRDMLLAPRGIHPRHLNHYRNADSAARTPVRNHADANCKHTVSSCVCYACVLCKTGNSTSFPTQQRDWQIFCGGAMSCSINMSIKCGILSSKGHAVNMRRECVCPGCPSCVLAHMSQTLRCPQKPTLDWLVSKDGVRNSGNTLLRRSMHNLMWYTSASDEAMQQRGACSAVRA